MSYVPATMAVQHPGQQNVVVIQQQTQGVRQGPRIYDRYAATQSKVLGIIQIVMGLLAIFFNALAIHFSDVESNSEEGVSYSGMGIWSGLWVSYVKATLS